MPDQEPVVVVIPAAAPVIIEASLPVEEAPVEPVVALETAVPVFVETTPVVVEPVVETPVAIEAAHPAPAAQPVIESVPANLEETLAETGLVMVKTTAPTFVAQAEPPVKLGRPRKQKPVAEQAEEAPLVMVETANK